MKGMEYLGVGVFDALHGYPTGATVAAAFKHVGTLEFTRPLAWGVVEGRRRGEWTRGGRGDACKYTHIGEKCKDEVQCGIP